MQNQKIGLIRRKQSKNSVAPSKTQRAVNWLDWSKQLFVVFAGVWVLYLYFEHDREQKKLSNEAMKIANEQAARLSKTEVDLKQAALEQQRLTLQMTNIAAVAESERSRLALEQQRVAVESAKMSASVQLQREKLSLAILELDRGLKRADLTDAISGKISVASSMRVRCDADRNYLVTYDVSVANISDKKSVEISWELRSVFVGLPHKRPAPIDGVAVLRLNEPPDPYTDALSESPIHWQSMGDVGYVYPGSRATAALVHSPFYFRAGGLLTKLLRPKDKSVSISDYEIAAPPGSWVAVVLRIGIDGETSGDGIFRVANWERLRDCSIVEPAANTPQNPK